MELDDIVLSDLDIQRMRNFELFFALSRTWSERRIIEDVDNLLKKGAQINIVNPDGNTILDLAHKKDYMDLATFLSGLGGKTAADLMNSQQQIQQSDYVSNQKLPLHVAAESGNVKKIASLLKLELPMKQFVLTEVQEKLVNKVDGEGNSLLTIAAKNGRKDNVEFFIRCGIDINHLNKRKESAVNLAWNNKHYDVVLSLLKADSDLPDRFDLTVLKRGKAQKALKEFVVQRWNSLHQQIKENDIPNIGRYTHVVHGPNLYLNSEGRSAMFTALVKKRFKIFAFLKYAGFMFKNEDEEECLNKIPQGEKDMLRTEMILKFPQIDDGHILYLTSKSRSRLEKPDDKERIEKLYRSLDAIPEVSTILKVVQYIDYLDIVFDFDNENNNDINPTASKATKGTTNYSNGKIYIAAKIEENKLLGTLAHELTHLAMYNLYKNDCNPFEKSEIAKRQLFAEITAKIKEYTKNTVQIINSNTEDSPLIILARAFTYPEDEQQSELIARIPHILAQYHDEGKRWLLNTDKEIKLLFDYYSDQAEGGTTYRCKKFIENSFLIKPRCTIQILNEYLGEINNVMKCGLNLECFIQFNDFLESYQQVLVLKTENTLLSILSIYESLIFENEKYIIKDSLFSEFNSYREKQDKINNIFYSIGGRMLCIRCPYDSNMESLSETLDILNTLLEQKSNKKIVFILADCKTKEFWDIKRVFNMRCYKNVANHKFRLIDLTKKSQQKLWDREVIFQGQTISLNKLIDKSDRNAEQILNEKILERLITNEEIKIGSIPLGTTDLEGAYSELIEEVNMESFINNLLSGESSDISIISGIPGVVTENKLIEYLVNADIDISKKSKLNDLVSRIAVLDKDLTRAIDNRIQLADDQFIKGDFRQICRYNRGRKIYWINIKHEDSAFKFILEEIYNPDFYLKGDRFNNEVAIEKNIKVQLGSSALSEIFIIGNKSRGELTKWLQFSDAGEQLDFQINCNNHRIVILNNQDNMSATFQRLVVQNPDQTYHLLKFERDQLIWCETHGTLENLCTYRAKDYRNTKPLMGEDDLIKKIKDDKVVIIVGDPGIGKTTALVKLYESQYASESGTNESIINSHWLIMVNLKDHLDAIRAIDFSVPTEIVKKIGDFLSQVDNSISDDFTRQLLDMALTTPNFAQPLLIVFDGFDQVLDETDRCKLISLLEHLKDKTEAKYWITTRPHYQQDLERAVSTFAIKLAPMDDERTTAFIVKYLKNHLILSLSHKEFRSIFGISVKIVENTRLQDYTKAFLSKMHELFVSKLIGTPLQLYLMVEGSARYFKEWMRHVDGGSLDISDLGNSIWEVYEKFVDRKYNIHFKKTKINEHLTQELDKIIFDSYHKAVTKSFIFASAPRQPLEDFKGIVLPAGIIKSHGSNLEFVHSTFRDFFAAKVVYNWTVKWKAGDHSKPTHSQNQEYLLKVVLIKSDYQMIRAFLNSKLLKDKMTNIHLQAKYYDKEVLFVAAKEGNVGIARFVLDNSEHASSNINDVKDDNGKTILHVAAASNGLDMLKFLIDEKQADFDVRDDNGNSVLHVAVKRGYFEIVKYLVNEKQADFSAENNNGVTILHLAACFDYLEILRFLIDENQADFDVRDNGGRTVLQMAVIAGNLDIIKFLINEKEADIFVKDNNGNTALHLAASCGHLDVVKFLINEKKIDFYIQNDNGTTVLHSAAVSGSLEMVKYLIDEKNADFNAKDIDGSAVLHLSTSCGHLHIVKYLINEKMADYNVQNGEGATILHTSVCFGFLEVVKFLINEKGADYRSRSKEGKSILHLAGSHGYLHIVQFLILEKGVDFNDRDNNGNTVLHFATQSRRYDVVKFLLSEGMADVNTVNNNGTTILHTAAYSDEAEMLKYLVIEKQADICVRDNAGNTVLHLAAGRGHLDMVKFLVNEKKADVNARDNDGTSVLHKAAAFGSIEIVKFLVIEKNADFEVRNVKSQTVLHFAASNGHLAVVKFLINEKNADFNVQDVEGAKILQLATRFGHLDVVKFLVNEKQVDFNAQNYDGTTNVYLAAYYGHLNIVQFLVDEKNADFKVTDHAGRTILQLAVSSGQLEMAKFLISKYQAETDSTEFNVSTYLHLAASSGHLDVVKFLVNEKMVDFNMKDAEGDTILQLAINADRLDMVKFLINEKNADFNAKDEDGTTILHMAVCFGSLKIVKFLINEKEADFNATDDDGISILHAAVSCGHLNIVKFLVNKKKVDFNINDNNGTSVLHMAACFGHLDIVRFLTNEKDADVNISNNNGKTVLHLAAWSGHLEIVKFLVNERNADVNAKDEDGKTVLHVAAICGHLDMIKFLVDETEADLFSADNIGRTIFHVAVKCVAEFLRNSGSVAARRKK